MSSTTVILVDAGVAGLRDPLRVTLETAVSLCREAGGPVTLLALSAARRRAPATVQGHLRALARLGWPLRRREGRAVWIDAARLPLAAERALTGGDDAAVKKDRFAAHARDIQIKAARREEEEAAAASSEGETAPQEGRIARTAQALKAVGVYPELAVQLARLPWVTADLVRRCALALEARRDVRNLPGLLVRVLRNKGDAIALARSAPERHLQASGRQSLCAAQRPARAHQSPEQRALGEIWQRALVQLRTVWGGGEVEAELGRAVPLGAENQVLLLSIPNTLACERLNMRARGAVLQAWQAVRGAPPLRDVQFVPGRLHERAHARQIVESAGLRSAQVAEGAGG